MRKSSWIALALAVSVLAVVPAAHADTFTNVTATGTWCIDNGLSNGQCNAPGVGINFFETITASFLWDVTIDDVVPGTASITSVGPMDPFTVSGATFDYVAANFYNSDGDLFQVYYILYDLALPGVYGADSDNLNLSCSECTPPLPIDTPDSLFATNTIVVTATPEPGTIALGLSGLMLIATFAVAQKHVHSRFEKDWTQSWPDDSNHASP